MASNTHYSIAVRNDMLNQLNTEIGASGLLRVYSGTQPATPDTALSGNTLLAELTLSATAFAAASGGVVTANAIGDDTDANATGTATFASFVSAGGTRVVDVSVGSSGADLNLNTVSIVQHALVRVTGYTFSIAA